MTFKDDCINSYLDIYKEAKRIGVYAEVLWVWQALQGRSYQTHNYGNHIVIENDVLLIISFRDGIKVFMAGECPYCYSRTFAEVRSVSDIGKLSVEFAPGEEHVHGSNQFETILETEYMIWSDNGT